MSPTLHLWTARQPITLVVCVGLFSAAVWFAFAPVPAEHAADVPKYLPYSKSCIPMRAFFGMTDFRNDFCGPTVGQHLAWAVVLVAASLASVIAVPVAIALCGRVSRWTKRTLSEEASAWQDWAEHNAD